MLEDQSILTTLRKSLPNSWCNWNTIHTSIEHTFFDLPFLADIPVAALVSLCILCKVPAPWPSWPYPYTTTLYPYALPRVPVPASSVCAFAFCPLVWPADPHSAMPVLPSLPDFSHEIMEMTWFHHMIKSHDDMEMESSCTLWKESLKIWQFCSALFNSHPVPSGQFPRQSSWLTLLRAEVWVPKISGAWLYSLPDPYSLGLQTSPVHNYFTPGCTLSHSNLDVPD